MDKLKFKVGHVDGLDDSPIQRIDTPADTFDHVDGTNPSNHSQVLDKYLDMDQDE
ncbi:hypothetical protein DPMN_073573 [Dreissena polymorpha]|uniref:Uncharacterized protein n=2 Tax=Dreissena polymorpha TaxID=45954 RepID=A0A9D4HB88_DREPO|nr:hypothetical protein DPMN_073573 [Dreissena polymorpha]